MNAIKVLAIELSNEVAKTQKLRERIGVLEQLNHKYQRSVGDLRAEVDYERNDNTRLRNEIHTLHQAHDAMLTDGGLATNMPTWAENFNASKKIPLIKQVRGTYSIGLKEAKDVVDEWERRGLWPVTDAQ